jgi:predicted transcriptional regulator
MSVLWATGPANVPVVLDRVNASRQADKALAYTTVMTVLARLHEKGFLSRERRGRGYEYRPRFDEAELLAHLSRREVDQLLARYGHVAWPSSPLRSTRPTLSCCDGSARSRGATMRDRWA